MFAEYYKLLSSQFVLTWLLLFHYFSVQAFLSPTYKLSSIRSLPLRREMKFYTLADNRKIVILKSCY
jgi:Zn-dependent protease with chaperone function